MQHLAQDQHGIWGSPRNTWGYGDETYMNCMKRLSRASTHPATLETVVLIKLALHNGITCFLGD